MKISLDEMRLKSVHAESRAPLRIAFVGCGWVTQMRHLPALRRVAGARVVAVADTDAASLRRVSDGFQIARRYADYRALLGESGFDAVAVCVPARAHAEVALAALDAGCRHLFVEKPLVLRLDECDSLTERARRAQAKVMVGFNLRWHRLVLEAREIIGGGSLGSLKLVRTSFTCGTRLRGGDSVWRRLRAEGGGVLFELAVHHFDLVRFLLGREVEEVFAVSESEDETATLAARLEGGVLLSSAFCEATADSHEIELFGERGRLRLSLYRSDGLEQFGVDDYPGALRVRLRAGVRGLRQLPRILRRAREGGDVDASYRAEWEHFVEAVRDGTPLQSTLEDGRRSLELTLAAARSEKQVGRRKDEQQG